MDNKDTLSRTQKETTLGSNSDYFKYVFKKTEKIICAVFYIIRANKDIDRTDAVVRVIEDTASRLTRASFVALKVSVGDSAWTARELGYALMELETSLRVAHAAGLIEAAHLRVFENEFDAVLRSLKPYAEPKAQNPFFDMTMLETPVRIEARPRKPSVQRGDGDLLAPVEKDESVKVDRVGRILTVLKDKGHASIKDISEVISDCSEKTIQRELNNLIKDNKVIRDGERRWSRYTLVTTQL